MSDETVMPKGIILKMPFYEESTFEINGFVFADRYVAKSEIPNIQATKGDELLISPLCIKNHDNCVHVRCGYYPDQVLEKVKFRWFYDDEEIDADKWVILKHKLSKRGIVRTKCEKTNKWRHLRISQESN